MIYLSHSDFTLKHVMSGSYCQPSRSCRHCESSGVLRVPLSSLQCCSKLYVQFAVALSYASPRTRRHEGHDDLYRPQCDR